MTTPLKTIEKTDPAYEGQAVYTPGFLRMYDTIAFRIDCPFLWRCPERRFQALYDEHAGPRHLDVGIGSGRLVDRCRFRVPTPSITLMDLNPHVLTFAARRLRRYTPSIHQANVLAPWGVPARSFDSIAMLNVLCCTPGPLRETAGAAFEQARAALAPGGTFFGATLLNGGVRQTRRSRAGLRLLNRRGFFDNLDDRLGDLEAALAGAFPVHEVRVQGSMGLFVARLGN